jgi:hypothetical protein
MNNYNVPPEWKEISHTTYSKGDFIGDPMVQHSWPIGWLTPDGFISVDKLPDQYRVKPDNRLLDADGSGKLLPENPAQSNSSQILMSGAGKEHKLAAAENAWLTIRKYCDSTDGSGPHIVNAVLDAVNQTTAELQRENDWLKLSGQVKICECGCNALEGYCSTAKLNDVEAENTQLKTQFSATQDQIVVLREALEWAKLAIDQAIDEDLIPQGDTGGQRLFWRDTKLKVDSALTSTAEQTEKWYAAQRDKLLQSLIDALKTNPTFLAKPASEYEQAHEHGWGDAIRGLETIQKTLKGGNGESLRVN